MKFKMKCVVFWFPVNVMKIPKSLRVQTGYGTLKNVILLTLLILKSAIKKTRRRAGF